MVDFESGFSTGRLLNVGKDVEKMILVACSDWGRSEHLLKATNYLLTHLSLHIFIFLRCRLLISDLVRQNRSTYVAI